jgi:leader peptidase (prepilin peptidase)/N-methyltransferase
MVAWTLLGFVLGTVLGSLAKALADRCLTNKTFLGRSYCPSCKHKLGWYDLFPLFSYLFLGGRCRYCHKKIGKEYVVVELIMGVLIGYLFYQSLPGLVQAFSPTNPNSTFQIVDWAYTLLSQIFLIVILVIITITDLKKTIIPDRITYPSIVIMFVALVGITIYRVWAVYQSILNSELGKYLLKDSDYFIRHAIFSGMIGGGAAADPLTGGVVSALLVGVFFLVLILSTKGRGMGGGDLKLGILLGLFFGFPMILLMMVLSFFLGAVVAVGLILFGKKHFGQTIPFGPFLAAAAIICIYWGNQILNWYLQLKLS